MGGWDWRGNWSARGERKLVVRCGIGRIYFFCVFIFVGYLNIPLHDSFKKETVAAKGKEKAPVG